MNAVVADHSNIDTNVWLDGDPSTCEQVLSSADSSFVEVLFMLPSNFQKVTGIAMTKPSASPNIDVTIENDTSVAPCLSNAFETSDDRDCTTAAYGQYVRIRADSTFQLCELEVHGEGM